MKLQSVLSKIITVLLFLLPVLFFTEVYFLQVVSAEDLYQGARLPISIINDSLNAFHWSARISDMYAWSVINFFDYTFQFGIDTLFRFLDVLAVTGILLIMNIIILTRRPRLQTKDAIIFSVSFLAIFLSIFSRPIIGGFSQIHNYLIITISTALFLLPFARELQGKYLSNSLINKLLMLIIGFLFAFSSNVTPATFLATAFVVVLYDFTIKKRRIFIQGVFKSWKLFALVGVSIGMFVMYKLGPGVSSYTNGYNSSYVSLVNLVNTPIASGKAIMSNMIHNFQLFLPMMIVLSLILLFEFVIYKKHLLSKTQELKTGVRFSAICLLFVFIHVAAVSQINIEGMTRVLLPAFVVVVVSVLFTVNRLLNIVSLSNKTLTLLAIPVLLLTTLVVLDIGILMVYHQKQSSLVFKRIQDSPESSVCVTKADNPSAKSPILKYYQRELFIDWMMPTTIYSKTVDWCK